ncbi:MAG: hypothetical protein ABI688_05780 [Bacteroidota bacterium]
MRKLLLPVLVFLIACNSKKDDKKPEKNENTDYLVTMDGIGPLTTEMTQQEIEKVLNKKIPLNNPNDTTSGSWEDTATVEYKEAELKLSFVRTYGATDSFYMRVTGMKTSSPLCKTNSGLGVGSSKQQIIDTYDDHVLLIDPDFEDTTYTRRSRSRYTINVRVDWEGPEIRFFLKDNKVYAIEVTSFHDDAE